MIAQTFITETSAARVGVLVKPAAARDATARVRIG